jgi:gliding motility-associated-like protein
MKRLLFFLPLFFLQLSIVAQFYSPTGKQATQLDISLSNIDEVFFFNGDLATAQIEYTYDRQTNFTCFDYTTNPSTANFHSSDNNVQTFIIRNLSNNTGYILRFDGQEKFIWVIDIKQYPVEIFSIMASPDNINPCSFVLIDATINNPPLNYIGKTGASKKIDREFTLSYQVANWDESSKTYNPTTETNTYEFAYGTGISIPTTSIPAPTINTAFTLAGDQIMAAFGSAAKASTSEYLSTTVEQHILAEINERASTNEKDRIGPATSTSVSGSGPLLVYLTSNASPAVQYYEWYIIRKDNRSDVNYYTDQDLRYTFKESGDYTVKLIASNASGCIAEDSITVTVTESSLQVPNVFTPNGDGLNDEFRVAYKSLKSYHCVVYNRWGRKVYEGSDPGKGWDGRVGGKYVTPGAYYYIIEATGTDGKKYKEKGDINVIRGK